ncbi:MAG: 50S ribosomal protein L3 [Lentisphaerae bacterium]|nr:MAG: 50S ribosomal protein L3 [Lentisphaerota bacterium]
MPVTKGLLGKKLGMTRILDESGRAIPVTVVEAGPCTVLQTRTPEKHGYCALQLGFETRKVKNVSKPERGTFRIAGREDNPPAWVKEIRLDVQPEAKPGDDLTADIFNANEYVDVTGVTKGRGFQGVVKRHNFGGGRASHGGAWTRKPGSIGMCEFPGKVFKGKKMPGQMGNVQRTIQNLEVVRVIPEENLILIKGAIPGPNGSYVVIRESKKKSGKQ